MESESESESEKVAISIWNYFIVFAVENLHYLYGDREGKPKVDMDWVESTSTATNPHMKWTIRTLCNGPARPTIPASLINSPSIYGGIWFRTNSQIAKSSKPILGAICWWAVCVSVHKFLNCFLHFDCNRLSVCEWKSCGWVKLGDRQHKGFCGRFGKTCTLCSFISVGNPFGRSRL